MVNADNMPIITGIVANKEADGTAIPLEIKILGIQLANPWFK